MKKFFKKTEGFTLVELIVVIAILGILAGVGTVGYSGYIKKAQTAADNQLLAAVNQAYAAACIENGVDAKTTTASNIALNDGKVPGVDVSAPADKADKIETAFGKYFAGNDNNKFKTTETLNFVAGAGVFALPGEGGGAYNSLIDFLKTNNASDITKVNASGFMTYEGLGVNSLLGKVDYVTGYAGDLIADDGSNLGEFVEKLGGDPYAEYMAVMLGADATEAAGDPMGALEAQLGIYLADGNVDTMKNIMSNGAVLYAAKNTDTSDTAKQNVLALLTYTGTGDQDPKAAIAAKLSDPGTAGEGFAQASMAYGLYTAYAHTITDPEERAAAIEAANDPIGILNGLNDAGVQAYLKDTSKVDKDLDGYLAAMNMITSSAENDSSMALNLMTNGFNDPSLATVIQQVVAQD